MNITMKSLLEWADEEHFAVVSFNYADLWTALGIIRAAERERAPIILQQVPPVVKNVGLGYLSGIGKAAAEYASVPIVHHLDHSTSPAMCFQAIDAGYGSVMIDGSLETMEENIRLTKTVVRYAHEKGVFVEGEIGKIRGKGWQGIAFKEGEEFLTRVEDAVTFVKETDVDALAVGIGNAHGFYTQEPKLNIQRLAEINEAIDTKLVLHGGTGIPEEAVRDAIRNGINKVNVGTVILHSYLDTLKATLGNLEKAQYNEGVFEDAVEAVSQAAAVWIRKTMSDHRV